MNETKDSLVAGYVDLNLRLELMRQAGFDLGWCGGKDTATTKAKYRVLPLRFTQGSE
jgi:hypothetical protein